MIQGIKRTILSNSTEKEIIRIEALTLLKKKPLWRFPKDYNTGDSIAPCLWSQRKKLRTNETSDQSETVERIFGQENVQNGSLKDDHKGNATGDWAMPLDLTDAYTCMHIPIRQSHQIFFRFAVDRQVWQFRALPFGLTTAPCVFMQLISVVVKYFRQEGIQIWTYLGLVLKKKFFDQLWVTFLW